MQRFLVWCALFALCAVAVAEQWPNSNPDVEAKWPPGQPIAAEIARYGKHRHAGHGRYEYKDTPKEDKHGYKEPKEPKHEYQEPYDKHEEKEPKYKYEADEPKYKYEEHEEKEPKYEYEQHKDSYSPPEQHEEYKAYPGGKCDDRHVYDGACVANNKGVTITGPINSKCPQPPNPNPEDCPVPELCPAGGACLEELGCPPGQWKRYVVAQVTDHFRKQPGFTMVDDRHYTFSCVDARGEEPMLGTPGGDLAEAMAAAMALHKLLGKTYDKALTDEVFKAFIDNVATEDRPFYLHTDDSRLRQMFIYLQGVLGVKPSMLPYEGPAGAEGQAWVEALSMSEYQGCGHIRQMLSDEFKAVYSVALNGNDIKDCTGVAPEACIDSVAVANQMLKDYFNYWWFTKPGSLQRKKIAFAVDGILGGPLLGKAVAIIQNNPKTACPHEAPLVRPNFGGSQVFVYHGDAVADWRAYAASTGLAGLLKKYGIATQTFVDAWTGVSGLKLGATLAFLPPANDIGIFVVDVPVAQGSKDGHGHYGHSH